MPTKQYDRKTGKYSYPIWMPNAIVPVVGATASPVGITGTATGAPVYQDEVFYPIDIGPTGWNADALTVNVSTAYSGATSPTVYGGLYATDANTGFPKTESLLGQGTGVTTATGVKTMTFATPVALSPGRYWIGILLAGSAVATAGAFTTMAGVAVPFPAAATTIPGTNVRALKLSGLTALKATATTPSLFTNNGGSTVPIAALRRSA